MTTRFFQRDSGVLLEHFDRRWAPNDDATERICEPGHQYEWSWLLRTYAACVGKADEPVARALKVFADRHGYDSPV